MSESLPAINIDQLTNAVNAVVNVKHIEPCSTSPNSKMMRAIAPHTTVSTHVSYSDSTCTDTSISSANQNLNLPSGNLPIMVSVQLAPSNGDQSCTPFCVQGNSELTTLQNLQPTAGSMPIPLSMIPLQDRGLNTSQQTLVYLNNLQTSNALPPFTSHTFANSSCTDLPVVSCSEASQLQLTDTTSCSYNQSSCSIGQMTSQELLTTPTTSTVYQTNTSSASIQHVLPNLVFSPSETNAASRFFMTSPLPMLSVNEKDTPITTSSSYSPRPLSVASNMSGISVIDALLKPQDNFQFLTPLPPTSVSVEKPVSIVKPVTDLSKRVPALPAYYCVECAHTHYSPCKHHACDYTSIVDTPVLSRARQSIPACLQIQFSKITGHFNDAGVIANSNISVMTQFGPLTGKSVRVSTDKDVHLFKHWKIFYTLENQYQCDILDVSDENYSNWLMFVKPARSSAEQNLVAYQCNDGIYFVTCKDIEPGSELLFWYSKEYAKLLGFMSKPNRINYCPYCFQCDKIFPDKKTLLDHKKTAHAQANLRKHQCQYCHKRFTTTGKLNTHIVAKHMQLKPYSCSQCDKQFSDQSNLRIHTAIHTGVKKFTCDLCKKSFRQKAHLTSHMLTHTKEKSVDCPHCEKKFARMSDMKQHQYNHTRERVFQCSHCNKIFYKLSNYKKHMKIHNNERNYECSSCQKSFYTKYHLQRHVKTCKRSKMASMVMQISSEGEMNAYNRPSEHNSLVDTSLTTCSSGPCTVVSSEMYAAVPLSETT